MSAAPAPVAASSCRWPCRSSSRASACRVVINLGTATIGSTVAAKGLGEVIIAGLLSNNTAFVLQGGLVVGLMAVLLYDALGAVETWLARSVGARTRGAGRG